MVATMRSRFLLGFSGGSATAAGAREACLEAAPAARRTCEQDVALFGVDFEALAEGVVPHVLHLLPVVHDACRAGASSSKQALEPSGTPVLAQRAPPQRTVRHRIADLQVVPLRSAVVAHHDVLHGVRSDAA